MVEPVLLENSSEHKKHSMVKCICVYWMVHLIRILSSETRWIKINENIVSISVLVILLLVWYFSLNSKWIEIIFKEKRRK